MRLTAEMFSQIVRSIRSDGSTNGLREQRRNPRVGISSRAAILVPPRNGGRLYPVSVRDLSATGIGLTLSGHRLAVDDEVLLMLPGSGKESLGGVLCKVVRMHTLTETLSSVGATFVREIPSVDLPVPAAATPTNAGASAGGRAAAGMESASSNAMNGLNRAAVRQVQAQLDRLG